jgi:hypothetical protein
MKLCLAIPIAIGLALVLTAVISAGPITQKAYAAVNSSGSLGQNRALGGPSGVMTGAGANVGGVDRHLFCDTGVITPVCK